MTAIVLSAVAGAASASQPCCCPDHGQDAPCAMSCGPAESPEAPQAAVPALTKPTVTTDAIPSSFTLLSVLYPPQPRERLSTQSDESPPKRYLRHRVLRL